MCRVARTSLCFISQRHQASALCQALFGTEGQTERPSTQGLTTVTKMTVVRHRECRAGLRWGSSGEGEAEPERRAFLAGELACARRPDKQH